MKLCAVVPVYNHGNTIGAVVAALRANDLPCVLVDDGSNATCAAVLTALANRESAGVELLRLPQNLGKGGAMQAGLKQAAALGYSHALQIDADLQHDIADIPAFIAAAEQHPDQLICGRPVYDDSVSKGRLYGRYATHIWVWINTLSLEITDSMCGFRVYPLAPVVALINQVQIGRRMDFDVEILVRLHWRGLRIFSLPTKVRYPAGGVSHFRLLRDNVLISWMHTKLFFGMLVRAPILLARKFSRWRTR